MLAGYQTHRYASGPSNSLHMNQFLPALFFAFIHGIYSSIIWKIDVAEDQRWFG